MERLSRAMQADGQDVGASTLERQAAIVATSADLLLCDAHLGRSLLSALPAARLHAEIQAVSVLSILFSELPLVPAMEEEQHNHETNDGYTAGN